VITAEDADEDAMQMKMPEWMTRDRLAMVAALLGPLGACAILVPFRRSLANTDAALVLVIVIVAVAALGNRLSAFLGALSAGVWFDFFLTKPYERFAITSRADVETTLLLLVVGVSVTELAIWGRREHARSGQQTGYLAGLHAASEVVATGGSPTQLADRVVDLLIDVLSLKKCHFHFGTGLGNPRLQHDGTVAWGETLWDVDNEGLPSNVETELLVSAGGRFWGRFLMTPELDSRPTLTQRLVAVSLADQVGAALSDYNADLG
jgi:K+-sensing histidine kinase KdpD